MENMKEEILHYQNEIDELIQIVSKKHDCEKQLKELKIHYEELKEQKYIYTKEINKIEKELKGKLGSIFKKEKVNGLKDKLVELNQQYEECFNTCETTYKNIRKAEVQIENLFEEEKKFKKLYNKIEGLLSQYDQELYAEIKKINTEIIKIEYILIDLKQAIEAGVNLRIEIRYILSNYNNVIKGNTLDMIGLDTYGTMQKYYYLSKIDARLPKMYEWNKKFIKEINDIETITDFVPDFTNLNSTGFLGYDLFDLDMMIFLKLVKAKHQLEGFYQDIQLIMNELETEQVKYNLLIKDLQDKKIDTLRKI